MITAVLSCCIFYQTEVLIQLSDCNPVRTHKGRRLLGRCVILEMYPTGWPTMVWYFPGCKLCPSTGRQTGAMERALHHGSESWMLNPICWYDQPSGISQAGHPVSPHLSPPLRNAGTSFRMPPMGGTWYSELCEFQGEL